MTRRDRRCGRPAGWRRDGLARRGVRLRRRSRRRREKTISSLQHDVLPASSESLGGAHADARRARSPSTRDFVHAVYGKFPYVLLFVLLLTFVLLMRAFRSIFLPLKAVILNLISLGAAYGIIVFIFQNGHGSEAIWDVPATDAIISWIPLMIFAFLFGLSMDYEVFMLTRMREDYDETGDTTAGDPARARADGQARDERGARARVLVLRALDGPGAGHQAVRRSGSPPGSSSTRPSSAPCSCPSIMLLLGRWNWWLPALGGKDPSHLPEPTRARRRTANRPVRNIGVGSGWCAAPSPPRRAATSSSGRAAASTTARAAARITVASKIDRRRRDRSRTA